MGDARDHDLSVRVESDIARANELFDRLADRAGISPVTRRRVARGTASAARRLTNIGIAIAALIAATVAFGLILGPIGVSGLFVVMALMILAVIVFSILPTERPLPAYKDDMPNQAVVQRLGGVLERKRHALPPPAGRQIEAISRQLPLLESRLAEADILDPLAQDARRLMGRHLPDLIERYERVPANYRRERDGEGLTADERLVKSLDAARVALDDLGRKLAHEDMAAFQTQGRFIESRYKDDDPALKGE